jgi:hypothetical protein
MYRLLAILALWPTLATADWSPRPSMFTYEATFKICFADPTAPNIATTCSDALNAAYVLKRAVAWAVYKCHPESIATCSGPFVDEGLPAIAAQIAVDTGCDVTDVTLLYESDQFSPNHCITVASYIMLDKGVVPLYTHIECRDDLDECGYLSFVNVSFWVDQVAIAAPSDTTFNILQDRNITECGVEKFFPLTEPFSLDATNCFAERTAMLWAYLAQQNLKD